MARLNESTAPPESVDALKRRFVRQNREIARVNSIQSLRIRSLESEVSHLLSENVSLREQGISLSQEIERYEAAKLLHDGVYDVKAKLDGKLAELSGLVSDLGSLPRKFGKLCEEKAESTNPSHSTMSSLYLRRRETDFEYNAAPEDGRLPAILEDKCYPRKTLESQELDDLMQNDRDSQRSPRIEEVEVGATEREQESRHFDPELPEGLTNFQIIDSDVEEPDTSLPPTLETRKKRKPSPIAMDKTEYASGPELGTTNHGLKFSLKSGAKRKFISEDDIFTSTADEEDDGFQYTRPSHLQNPSDQSTSIHDEYPPVERQVERKRGSRDHGSSKRKVLEPKSTNIRATLPNKFRDSPDKNPREALYMQDRDQKLPAAKPKTETNRRQIDVEEKSFDRASEHSADEDNDAKHAEFRSLGRSPSLSTPEMSKEATSDALDAQPRPSRRQRAVVSYTEPNLRDKMRRPTNEFADAVTGRRSRRSSNPQGSRTTTSDGIEGPSHSSDAAAGDANYPSLGPRESFPEQSMSMVSQRKRKTLPANKDDPSIYDYSGAETSPVSLQRGSDMRHEQGTEDDYAVAPSRKSATRQARRHSSNPRPFGRSHPSQDSADSAAGESQQVYPKDATTASTVLDCDESMVAGTEKHVLEADSHVRPGISQSDMQHTAYLGRYDAKQTRRGQRVAARRKSMML